MAMAFGGMGADVVLDDDAFCAVGIFVSVLTFTAMDRGFFPDDGGISIQLAFAR